MRWTPRSLANPQPAADQPGRLTGLLRLLRQRLLRHRLPPHTGSENDPLANAAGAIDTDADETDDEVFNERDSVVCDFVPNAEAGASRSGEPTANLSEGAEHGIGSKTWPLAATRLAGRLALRLMDARAALAESPAIGQSPAIGGAVAVRGAAAVDGAAVVGEKPRNEDDEARLEARMEAQFATSLNRHCLVESRRACSRRRAVAEGRARSAPPQRVCRRGG
jgi:hypothetical protein